MLLRFDAAGDTCRWWLADAGASGHGTVADAAAATGSRQVVVLVPGTVTLLRRVRVPVRKRNRAVAAVPWALEDLLAEDVEDLHFAVGARAGADGCWPTAVIARTWMDRVLACCAAAGLEPRAFVPEPLALPAAGPRPPDDGEVRWTALEEPGRVTIRTGPDSGLACEPELLASVLVGEEVPAGIDRRIVAGTGAAEWPPAFAGALGTAVVVADPLQAFDPAGSSRLNLLQGAYASGDRAVAALRRWAVPAALAAGLLLVAGVQLAIDHRAMGAREAQLREQIDGVFRAAFPEAAATRDPRAQMEVRLASLRANGDGQSVFAEALLRAGAALADHDDVRPLLIEWRSDTLELEIEARDLPALDRVQRDLRAAGFDAELRAVERNENRATGRLRLTENGR